MVEGVRFRVQGVGLRVEGVGALSNDGMRSVGFRGDSMC